MHSQVLLLDAYLNKHVSEYGNIIFKEYFNMRKQVLFLNLEKACNQFSYSLNYIFVIKRLLDSFSKLENCFNKLLSIFVNNKQMSNMMEGGIYFYPNRKC